MKGKSKDQRWIATGPQTQNMSTCTWWQNTCLDFAHTSACTRTTSHIVSWLSFLTSCFLLVIMKCCRNCVHWFGQSGSLYLHKARGLPHTCALSSYNACGLRHEFKRVQFFEHLTKLTCPISTCVLLRTLEKCEEHTSTLHASPWTSLVFLKFQFAYISTMHLVTLTWPLKEASLRKKLEGTVAKWLVCWTSDRTV